MGERESGRAGQRASTGIPADRGLPGTPSDSHSPALPLSGERAGEEGRTWRLVDPGAGPRRGCENMAIDQALLEAVNAGGLPALRFYYWDPPCLSLGRNQPARGVYDRGAAAARGIDIVRRPTGGRAVLHDRELTYCVVVPVGELGPPRQTYSAINRALVAGLRRLGVPALVVPESGSAGAAPQEALGASPCFDVAAPGEVVAQGRKLIGSAQRQEGGVLLQHGSLLLDGDQAAVVELRVEPGPVPLALLPRPATLRELLGEAPARAALEGALAAGFEEALGIRLAPSRLSGTEAQAVERWAAHFASDEWTWRR